MLIPTCQTQDHSEDPCLPMTAWDGEIYSDVDLCSSAFGREESGATLAHESEKWDADQSSLASWVGACAAPATSGSSVNISTRRERPRSRAPVNSRRARSPRNHPVPGLCVGARCVFSESGVPPLCFPSLWCLFMEKLFLSFVTMQ